MKKKNKIPRWLELQAEIDYRYWILRKMLDEDSHKPPISRMIDEATGYDKELQKTAEEIIAEIEEMKKEYYSI